MQISCPHCNTALDVAPEHFGQQVQCPACNNRFQIPEGPTEPSDPDFQKPERQGWEEGDHANVNFGKSFPHRSQHYYCLVNADDALQG